MTFSQPDSTESVHYALFLKGGLSEYTYTVPGGVGGSGSSTQWNMGPTFGIGFQFPASRNVPLMLVLDYSTNPYQTPSGVQLVNDARASIVDLSLSARYDREPVFLAGGLGFSHSHRNEAKFVSPLDVDRGTESSIPGEDETTLLLNLILGVQYKLATHVSMFIQGDARIRSYSSFTVEAGLAYEF